MNENLRKVRSFVRRPGRMTVAQQRALDTLLPLCALPEGDDLINLDALFGRDAPRVLDIGFGDGEALATSAANHPEADFLGVEVHEPGVGHLLILREQAKLDHVRVAVCDAVELITSRLEAATFDLINLFFPDPWPKKRHHKRRIVQPAFLVECARILRPSGLMHIATDWADYARHVEETFAASDAFICAGSTAEVTQAYPVALRPPTKFERRGLRLGHDIVDFYYRKVADAT